MLTVGVASPACSVERVDADGEPEIVATGVIFPAGRAEGIYAQCSADQGTVPAERWSPRSADIHALEERLSRFARQAGFPKHPLSDYRRQYAGYVLNEKRYIYVNALHVGAIELQNSVLRSRGEDTANWKREPFVACDGGDWFWQVHYDVERRRFERLRVNFRLRSRADEDSTG